MKNNDMISFDIRQINFSATKMFKMGFWVGAGMFTAKTICTVLFGKAIISGTTAAAKRSLKKSAEEIYDEVKNAVNERINGTDPELISKMAEVIASAKKKMDETMNRLDTEEEPDEA